MVKNACKVAAAYYHNRTAGRYNPDITLHQH